MAVTITDSTTNPELVTDGQTLTAYKGVTVADTGALSNTETVTITLSQSLSNAIGPNYGFYPSATDLGTITDPNGGGTFDPTTETFTESGVVGGDPTFATDLLSRLVYSAPTLPNGQAFATQALVKVTDGASTAVDTPIIVGDVAPPQITGTVANEPIAAGDTIRPFAAASLTDPSFSYDYYTIVAGSPYNSYVYGNSYYYSPQNSASITITDGGKATDADGLLTGAGLSKTGVGTYSISATSSYGLASELAALSFQTVSVAAGQTSNPSFELDVTDAKSGLTTKDTTTSLLVIGPALSPVPPSIALTKGGQTVAPGNVISPFNAVTISDSNPTPTDAATITLTNPAAGSFVAAPYLTETAVGSGVYTLAATSPATLTSELNALSFSPAPLPSGQSTLTTGFTLAVTDPTANTTATDTTTSVTEVVPPTAPSSTPTTPASTSTTPSSTPTTPAATPTSNFLVSDETTGTITQTPGQAYSGPVAGLTDEIIIPTTDKINVNAEVPNVFIKTGSGEDALDVSAVNGNNVLDGSTGSNFLVGGTGNDTFFTDLRDAAGPTWDTIAHFHAGDAVTVWGVTASDFTITMANGQGAAGYTGLTLDLTAPGQPDAKVTLAGFTQADVSSGKVAISYGTSPTTPGLPGSAYMQITATT